MRTKTKQTNKSPPVPCPPIVNTEWQGSRPPAPASALPSLPIFPFVCRSFPFGSACALCLALPSLVLLGSLWKVGKCMPWERNIPAAAVPAWAAQRKQLNGLTNWSSVPACTRAKSLGHVWLYSEWAVNLPISILSIAGCVCGEQQTSLAIQFAHLICDHLPLGLNWFIFFSQLSSLGILGLLSPDSFSMAWGISYSVWLKKPFFPPPPPSFSLLHSFQGQTAWVFPESCHWLLVPHVSMMPVAGLSTCMAESIKSQRSLKRRINVSFASEGPT